MDENINEQKKTREDNQQQMMEQGAPEDVVEIDLFELLLVLWRSKRFIIGLVIIASLVAGVYGLMQEPEYEASSTFAPRTREVIQTELGETQRLDTSVMISLLESQSLAFDVVEDLNLTEVWELESQYLAAGRAREAINISPDADETVITVSYRSTDPELAHDMVQSYINNFRELNREVNQTEAVQALEFVEERLEEVQANLEDTEKQIQNLQEEYGIYAFEAQRESLSQAYMNFQDKLRTRRIDYEVKSESLSANNPKLRELEREIEAIEENIRALERGTFGDNLEGQGGEELTDLLDEAQLTGINIGMRDIPHLNLQLTNLEQELKIQRDSYEMLRSQQEDLQVEAAREQQLIRMIDPPQFPEKPVGRGIKLNVIIAAFLALMLGVFVAFARQALQNADLDEEVLEEIPFLKKLQ